MTKVMKADEENLCPIIIFFAPSLSNLLPFPCHQPLPFIPTPQHTFPGMLAISTASSPLPSWARPEGVNRPVSTYTLRGKIYMCACVSVCLCSYVFVCVRVCMFVSVSVYLYV